MQAPKRIRISESTILPLKHKIPSGVKTTKILHQSKRSGAIFFDFDMLPVTLTEKKKKIESQEGSL